MPPKAPRETNAQAVQRKLHMPIDANYSGATFTEILTANLDAITVVADGRRTLRVEAAWPPAVKMAKSNVTTASQTKHPHTFADHCMTMHDALLKYNNLGQFAGECTLQ
jgi:hypothetical protein